MSWDRSVTFGVVLVCVCLSFSADRCNAAKILVLPTPVNPSHTFTMRKIYDELVSRNHDVQARRSLFLAEVLVSDVGIGTFLYLTGLYIVLTRGIMSRKNFTQVMIVEADIPRLTAVTQAGNVLFMTHQTPDLDLHSLVRQDRTPSFKLLAGKAHRLWLSACDALLNDDEAINKIQVKPQLERSHCINITPAHSMLLLLCLKKM